MNLGDRDIRIPFFLFQLVAIRPIGDRDFEVTEVETVSLVTRPTTVNYSYKAGSHDMPTPSGFFSDEGGVIGTNIQIAGTSGVAPRRVGMRMVSGWERLKEFREKVFKLSHTISEEKAAQILYAMSNEKLSKYAKAKQIVGADVVYAVNYYDFWNDEKFCVDITGFAPSTQARMGRNTQYSITMQILGDIIETKTTDTLLLSLQSLAWVNSQIDAMTGEANAWLDLSDSIAAKYVGAAVFLGEGLLDTMDVGSTALEGVLQVLPEIKSTLTGGAFKTTALSASRKYSRFLGGL